MCLPWFGGSFAYSAVHPWLLMAWAIFWFLILYGLLPLGARFCLIVGFSSFSLLFYSFRSLATISCRTTLLFLLWCYLTQACWVSLGLLPFLNDSIWSLDSYSCHFELFYFYFLLHCLWASLSHLFLLGHPWPICFPWASLALFLILRSHGFLLTPLEFPNPITLSFILEAHGFSINPLLSLFTLLRACCGPFLLFYITYCPWICYFSL